MTTTSRRGTLYVEGADDEHAIKQLLARHSIHIHDSECELRVIAAGSDSEVIAAIAVAIKGAGCDPVGFVMDTDAYSEGRVLTRADRWRAVRNKLVAGEVLTRELVCPLDEELPTGGFIGRSEKFNRRVGVWLMPDNRADYGKIEDLLATLVPLKDPLFELAKRSTCEAIEVGKRDSTGELTAIGPKDERKGQLHAWLAWQEEPGMSYGHALRRKYFECTSEVADRFVTWFQLLYNAEE